MSEQKRMRINQMSAGMCKHCRAWLWHRQICFTCGRRQ